MIRGVFLTNLCGTPRARVIRFAVMRTLLLFVAALALVAFPVHAQETVAADSGRFIVFQGSVPVAHENFAFQWMGDSLLITALCQRTLLDEQGGRHPFRKSLSMVVDSRDLGLTRYTSVQEFQGHTLTRGLVPGDTSITYFGELDGGGNAMRLAQPPGRLYVMDSQLFSLFEVLCRSLAPKTFAMRRVQLLALSDSMTTPLATVTLRKPDTLRVGSRRVPTKHYTFADESVSFELWADDRGRMMRLTHDESELHVEREPDAPTPVRRRARGAR